MYVYVRMYVAVCGHKERVSMLECGSGSHDTLGWNLSALGKR
jgi:hypothetical protein